MTDAAAGAHGVLATAPILLAFQGLVLEQPEPLPARQAPPPMVALPSQEERTAFERVRQLVRVEDYESARAIVREWSRRYPDPEPYQEGDIWKSLDSCIPLPGQSSRIGRALVADVVGLPDIALDGYAEHIAKGTRDVWTSKTGFCMYAARCAIQLDQPQRALEYLDLAVDLAGEDLRGWKEAKRDSYRVVLSDPLDLRARIRFIALFWRGEYPPYRSPIPNAIAAIQDILDDHAGDLEDTLRAELYLWMLTLELSIDRSRARFWARRLVRDVPIPTAVASLPRDHRMSSSTFEPWLGPRCEVLWTTAELLEEAGELASAVMLLAEVLRPTSAEARHAATPDTHAYYTAGRLSILCERLGDLARAVELQLAALEILASLPSCGTCAMADRRTADERITSLRRRMGLR